VHEKRRETLFLNIILINKICRAVLCVSSFLTVFFLADMSYAFFPGDSKIEKMATDNGFCRTDIKTNKFILASWWRFQADGDTVRIYIEGDGRAWKTKRKLSSDPTPRDPLAFKLAVGDRFPKIAYLSRPGQYVMKKEITYDPEYWSGKRFSEEVIESENEAVDEIKRSSGAKNVELIGYSGGGAVAVLVAARRTDVVGLRTVAGNLDPEEVNKYHKVDQLAGSLDPMGSASDIAYIPQRHFAGERDKTIPIFVTRMFARKAGDTNFKTVTVAEGATHHDGWVEKWPELLAVPLVSAR